MGDFPPLSSKTPAISALARSVDVMKDRRRGGRSRGKRKKEFQNVTPSSPVLTNTTANPNANPNCYDEPDDKDLIYSCLD